MKSFPSYKVNPKDIEYSIQVMTDPFLAPIMDSFGNKIWKNKEGQRHRINGPAIIYSDNHMEYFFEGKLHRTDGPALFYNDGYEAYFLHGIRHREDGPALIYEDGTEVYYVHGLKHRDDGPAQISPNGHKEFWINNEIIDEKDFWALKKAKQIEIIPFIYSKS